MNLIGMKRISRPPNGAILNEIIGIWYIHGFYLGTVVYGKNVLKGLQSVLFVRTHRVAYDLNGGPCVRTQQNLDTTSMWIEG